MIIDQEANQEVGRAACKEGAEGWHTATFVPLQAGLYSLWVRGDETVEPAGDGFAVVEEAAP